MKKRDIRQSQWFEEVAEYFDLDPALVAAAVPARRVEAGRESRDVREARLRLRGMFMRPESVELLERIQRADPESISDDERSASWKEYIFVCINGERRAFQRLPFYDRVIRCVVEPLLGAVPHPTVVDYGCGPSLLTRLLAQDFGDRIRTVSVDVGRYAVEFSVARNRLYNPDARGILLDDVRAPLHVRGVDLILAYSVFEHLPDSTRQIGALIDCLADGGMLIENYSGHSSERPHKSDTFDAYRARDRNLDLLRSRLGLVYGSMPDRRDGVYARDRGDRYWMKGDRNAGLTDVIRYRLGKDDARLRSAWRGIVRRARSSRFSGLLERLGAYGPIRRGGTLKT